MTEPWPHYETVNFAITHLYCAVALIGLIGNGSILSAIIFDRRLHNNTNILLVNGCIADILVSIFVASMQYYERLANSWQIGIVLCKTREFVAEFSPQTSIIIMMEIAIERYIAITRPLLASSVLSKKKLLSAAAAAWILPALISGRLLVWANTVEFFGVTQCYANEVFHPMIVYVSETVLFYVMPLVAMTIVYSVVIGHLKRSIKQQAAMVRGTRAQKPSAEKVTRDSKTNAEAISSVQDSKCRLDVPGGSSTSQARSVHQQPQRLQQHQQPQHQQTNFQSSQQQSQVASAKSRMNVVSMLAINVILFALFTFPIHFSRLFMSINGEISLFGSDLLGFVVVANSLAFRCLDSALNPTIIIILSPRIRGSIKRLFCRRCPSTQSGPEGQGRSNNVQTRPQNTNMVMHTSSIHHNSALNRSCHLAHSSAKSSV